MKHKVALWAVAVSAIFIFFRTLPADTKELFDPYIVGVIGISSVIVGIIMIRFTAIWTARAMGLMSCMWGSAVLYNGSLLFYLFPETTEYFGPVTDAARAFLLVGGPLLLFGIWKWVNEKPLPPDDMFHGD